MTSMDERETIEQLRRAILGLRLQVEERARQLVRGLPAGWRIEVRHGQCWAMKS